MSTSLVNGTGGAAGARAPPALNIEVPTSRAFAAWPAEQCVSLAVPTYQAATEFFLGLKHDRRLEIFNGAFRCIALSVTSQILWWPQFITELAADDRYDLNGSATEGGDEPATALRSDRAMWPTDGATKDN